MVWGQEWIVGEYISMKVSHEVSRAASIDAGSPLDPKLRKEKREKQRNECISQKIAGMSRSLQKAWILGHPPYGQGTPTSWPGKPAKVAEKQEEEERYRGRRRGCKLLSTFGLSLYFSPSPSPPPHLSFSPRRGSNVDFWALGRLILPTRDTVNT